MIGLFNAIAYDGQLEPGQSVPAHAPDDPEIVLVETDDADDVARVRTTSRTDGWWPVGALLARVLADYHHSRGESVGVVTPYRCSTTSRRGRSRNLQPAEDALLTLRLYAGRDRQLLDVPICGKTGNLRCSPAVKILAGKGDVAPHVVGVPG